MVTVRNAAAGSAAITRAAIVAGSSRALQLQQLFELLGAARLRVGVLEFDAEPIELQLQRIGSRAVPLERDVVAPGAGHALRDPRRAAPARATSAPKIVVSSTLAPCCELTCAEISNRWPSSAATSR